MKKILGKILGIFLLIIIILGLILKNQLSLSYLKSNKYDTTNIKNESEEKAKDMDINITWYGQSCVKIDNGLETIVIDPYSNDIGYGELKLEANKVLVTHSHYDHNNVEAVNLNQYIGTSYSIKEIESFHDNEGGKLRGKNKIYVIDTEGFRLCHLGDLGHILSDEQVSEIGNIDVLFIPVGGVYTINGAEAKKVVEQINPKVVIPIHYKTKDVNIDIEGVENFVENIQESYDVEYYLANNVNIKKDMNKKVIILDYK